MIKIYVKTIAVMLIKWLCTKRLAVFYLQADDYGLIITQPSKKQNFHFFNWELSNEQLWWSMVIISMV